MASASLPHIPASSHLTPLVIRVSGGNPGKFTLQGTNTYLLGRGGERLLIDTGQGFPIWAETIKHVLQQENAVIKTVLLTHHHHDHVSGLKDIPREHGSIQVWRHPALPSSDVYKEMLKQSLEEWGDTVEALEDGTTFDVPGADGVTLRTVHAPGHTPDHCVFILEKRRDVDAADDTFPVLFTGDAVLGHGTAVFEDLAVYIASLHKMHDAISSLESVSDTVRAYPAHGEVIDDAPGKLREYIEHRAQREREVVDILRSEQTDSALGMLPLEIVKIIYKDYPESLHAPAEGGLKLTLKKLEGEGKVETQNGRWKLVGTQSKDSIRSGL